MEKGKKNHLSRQFLNGGTSTEQSGTGTTLVLSTGTHCSVLTSDRILAITWSFLI